MPGEQNIIQNVSTIELELHFLIARFLSAGPCKRAAEVLKEELQQHKLLPKRTDWQGLEHYQSYENLVQLNRHISSDHLLKICQRLGPLLDKEIHPSVKGVRSLLGAGTLSLLRTQERVQNPRWKPVVHSVLHHHRLLLPPRKLVAPSPVHVVGGRETTGLSLTAHIFPVHIYTKISMHCRRLGHLSAVYCVTFDRTGNYIFTGSDDHLVKIWSVADGRLLATLRGQSAEITDLALNYENTLLAAGCTDKIIRVWCLKTQMPVSVLNGHAGLVTSLQFCPLSRGESRYLLSTGGDGCVCFWHWNSTTNFFDPKPIKFIERSRSGAQMLCSAFSPGGVFLATGNSDHVIRVYFVHGPQPEKICELESHTDRVDSISYNNIGDRFISGSRDGSARIWRFDRQEWKNIHLNMMAELSDSKTTVPQDNKNSKTKLTVTMISWNQNDSYVITAVSDYSLKVWNSHTGKLVHILKAHEEEVFVLEHSPVDPRILLSAGHDGKIIIWNLYTGNKIKTFTNMIEGQGHGAIFDCKFSPDGQSFSATDAYGQILIFGFGSSDKYKKIPEELFFHTDYRPLIRDANEYVLDEQTQQAPHLMPPPFLVDIDGNPYPPSIQRLVPGRENCTDTSLIPQITVNEEGEQEVLGEVPVIHIQPDFANEDRDERVILDSMIERLQREQDERLAAARGEPFRSPPPPGGSPRAARSNSSNSHMVGMRRSGETEGVRQSLGNISQRATQRDIAALRHRVVVRGLDSAVLKREDELRHMLAAEEVKKFTHERKRKPTTMLDTDSSDSAYMKTRKKDKSKSRHKYLTRTVENEETVGNRLATRALYDTEEEDEQGDGSGSDFWGDSSDNNINSESSECSDWVGDNPVQTATPVKRSQRKRKRKKFSSSENDDDDDDDDDDNDKDNDMSYNDPKNNEDSKSSDGRERRSKRKRPPPKKKKTSSPKKKVVTKKMKEIKELPENFRPPDWLTDTIPRKAPYVPQMGDEVMYFRQGHELYVQVVKRTELYSISKKQPWDKISNLREQELVKIVGLTYEIRPPRLCCLKLASIDPVTRKRIGGTFNIRYHDMPDVIDFLVLQQNYNVAIDRKWSPGDRFRSMIDDAWWMGTIESQVPFQEEFPDSMFQCFNVHWDNGEREKLSPWDLEPIDANFVQDDAGGGQPVNPEELKSLMYTPIQGEWPPCGRNSSCDRISHGLELIMEHSIAEPFLTPVDLNAFPVYAMVIEYPIDLTTIKNRLDNRFYRRISALHFDIRRLAINAEKFNEPGTPIVKTAKILLDTLMDFIADSSCDDPIPLLNERCKDQELFLGSSSDTSESGPSSSRQKKSLGGGQNKRRHLENKVTDPDAWKEQCHQLVEMMFQCEDSEPFRAPVNPSQYPNYHDLIDTPIDLSTIREQLQMGNYTDPTEMCKDVRLLFQNSKQFNTNKRSRIYAMTLRLSAMFEEKIRDVVTDWKKAAKHQMSTASATRRSNRRVKKRKIMSPESSETEAVFSNVSISVIESRTSASAYTADSSFSAMTIPSQSQTEEDSSAGPSTSAAIGINKFDKKLARRKKVPVVESDEDEAEDTKDKGETIEKTTSSTEEEKLGHSSSTDSEQTEEGSTTEELSDVDGEENKENRLEVGVTGTTSKRQRGKPKLLNGHTPTYMTRTSTGDLKKQKYAVDTSVEQKNDSNSDTDLELRQTRSLRKSKSSVRKSSPLTGAGNKSASGSDSDSSSSSSSSSDSSSDSSNSDSDYNLPKSVPSKTKSTAKKTKPISTKQKVVRQLLQERRSCREGKTRNRSHDAKRINTRNQGRRTVQYREDSDKGEENNDDDDNDNDEENDSDSDGESDTENSCTSSRNIVSRSSRGRLRKLTPRARASLLGE